MLNLMQKVASERDVRAHSFENGRMFVLKSPAAYDLIGYLAEGRSSDNSQMGDTAVSG